MTLQFMSLPLLNLGTIFLSGLQDLLMTMKISETGIITGLLPVSLKREILFWWSGILIFVVSTFMSSEKEWDE